MQSDHWIPKTPSVRLHTTWREWNKILFVFYAKFFTTRKWLVRKCTKESREPGWSLPTGLTEQKRLRTHFAKPKGDIRVTLSPSSDGFWITSVKSENYHLWKLSGPLNNHEGLSLGADTSSRVIASCKPPKKSRPLLWVVCSAQGWMGIISAVHITGFAVHDAHQECVSDSVLSSQTNVYAFFCSLFIHPHRRHTTENKTPMLSDPVFSSWRLTLPNRQKT